MIYINDNSVFANDKLIGRVGFINSSGVCKLHLNTKTLPSIIKIDGKEFKTKTGVATNCYSVNSHYGFVHNNIRIEIPEGETIYHKDITFSDIENLEKRGIDD